MALRLFRGRLTGVEKNMCPFDKHVFLWKNDDDFFSCHLVLFLSIPGTWVTSQNETLVSDKVLGALSGTMPSPLLYPDIPSSNNMLHILSGGITLDFKPITQDSHVAATNADILLKHEGACLPLKGHTRRGHV
jgi:hypothetical protein